MYTQCPNNNCGCIYRVRAQTLRVAMGMVRCPRCKTVFNALTNLTDEVPGSPATRIGNQLPIIRKGDRVLLDYKAVAAKAWHKSLTDSPEQGKPSQVAGPTPDHGPEKYSPSPSRRWDFSLLLPSISDFGLAFRNLTRHRKRTALGLTAISFGVTALLLAGGFIEWNNWALRESTIQSQLGHIQVVVPGYFEQGQSDPMDFLLPAQSAVFDTIEKIPHVEAITPRLSFTGLISHGEASVSFVGDGVVAENEHRVSRQVMISEGQELSSEHPDGIILGKGLAANLAVKPGDRVVLLATPASGGMNGVDARIRGIFYTSSKPYDDSAIRVPISMARKLMRVTGAHKWVVLLDETDKTDMVLETLRVKFPESEVGLRFVPWIDLADFYKKVVVLFTAQVNLVRFIIALIILVSISNTLAMAVIERTAEIGTLMAMGVKRAKVLALFVDEGVLLGLVGGIIGVCLGVALGDVISEIGIPMPPSPGMDFSFTGQITVTSALAVGGLVLAVSTTVLASVYPAWKASRLTIVDALRHAR